MTASPRPAPPHDPSASPPDADPVSLPADAPPDPAGAGAGPSATGSERPGAPPPATHRVTGEVLDRVDGAPDPRLREIVRSLIRHLHAFAVDVRLTGEEWQAGIAFLTETGRLCDAERQEFVLLSDVLGLSTLVDDLADTAARGEPGAATESTILGPFYVPGAPLRGFGESIALTDGGGQPLLVCGTVTDTGGNPLEGAVVDVWQTAPNGHYDVQDADQPHGNFRGRFRTAADGRYRFATVRPVSYPVPDDGPAGRLLRATGRHPWRPAHIHAIVSAPGHRTLTTTVFDADDAYLDSDAVFGVKDSRVRRFTAHGAAGLRLEEHFRLPRVETVPDAPANRS